MQLRFLPKLIVEFVLIFFVSEDEIVLILSTMLRSKVRTEDVLDGSAQQTAL